MELENLISVQTRNELRNWLEVNSAREKCCWVIVSVAEQPGVIQYLDAVEEAQCVGWIDGVKKKTSDTHTAQRLSPRKPKSNWTELNKERVRRLTKLGLMKKSELSVLLDMRPESFTIDEDIHALLKRDDQVYENFMNFPELYQRIRIETIQSYRKEPETFTRRLEKFIQHTSEEKMYGQWSNYGRLITY